MKFDERIALISQWAEGVLGEFTRPAASERSAAVEAKDIAEIVNRALPGDMKRETMIERLDKARLRLKENAKTRAWPIPREFLEAAKRGDRIERGSALEEMRITRIIDWWRKHREPARGYSISFGDVREIVKRGVATPRELYDGGFDLPPDLREAMGPPSEIERERHERVMAELDEIRRRFDENDRVRRDFAVAAEHNEQVRRERERAENVEVKAETEDDPISF
jgi:hypothetical protein